MEPTKRCSKCKTIKSISEFQKDPTKKNGYRSNCKVCCHQYAKKYRQTEKYRVKQKRYQKSEKGKANHQSALKRFNFQYPNQEKAQHAVNYEIRKGNLPHANTRLCHYCPKPAQQYHHWHGYEPKHRLDVVPVCTECHGKCKKKTA